MTETAPQRPLPTWMDRVGADDDEQVPALRTPAIRFVPGLNPDSLVAYSSIDGQD